MAKSGKIPPIQDQLKYARPIGDLLTAEINRIMDEAPKKDKAVAMFAMIKVFTIIWVNLMREMDMDPLQAIVMVTDIWKSVEETDEMLDAAGGIH